MNDRLSSATKAWVLTDGKAGDETQTFGIAEALGLIAERHLVEPRPLYAMFMPYGPIDPRDRSHRAGSPIAPPFPDIAIAAGRRTVAYLGHLKHLSRGRTFTVFVKDPYVGRKAADVIWVPRHDRLRGVNVVVTDTPAHRVTAGLLTAARDRPDPRLAALTAPRVAMVLGGPSLHHRFPKADKTALIQIACQCAISGLSVMMTGSRRTPMDLIAELAAALAHAPGQHFVWDGSGNNPYVSLLALADWILVTGDSVNMMAEAAATGAPVHIYEPDGGHAKMTAYVDYLITSGAARRWTGRFETWAYAPIDATPVIASEIARRYQAWLRRESC